MVGVGGDGSGGKGGCWEEKERWKTRERKGWEFRVRSAPGRLVTARVSGGLGRVGPGRTLSTDAGLARVATTNTLSTLLQFYIAISATPWARHPAINFIYFTKHWNVCKHKTFLYLYSNCRCDLFFMCKY